MSKIQITGIDPTKWSTYIELDGYVPISFRSYEFALGGVRDARILNDGGSFLELKMGLNSTTLRGFTLLSFEKIHEPQTMNNLVEISGLPILAIDETRFEGRESTQYLDLPGTFSVGFGKDFVEIDLGMLSTATRVAVCGPARFFIDAFSLVGIQVSGLSEEEIAGIRVMVVSEG